jgi:hypothetical protein
VLEGFLLGRGRLWVGSGASKLVGIAQGRRLLGGGPWVQTSPSLRFSWLGSGLRALESIEERSRSMATVLERASTVQLQ